MLSADAVCEIDRASLCGPLRILRVLCGKVGTNRKVRKVDAKTRKGRPHQYRMLKRLCLLQTVLLLTAGTVVAQSSSELQSKYGSPQDAFVIRPGLLMTAKYAADGRACELYIIEARTPGSNIIVRTPLTAEIVPVLIDELVPEGERGRKLRWPVQVTGMTLQAFYKYEHVWGEFVQNLMPSKGWSDSTLKIKWGNRVCR